MTSFYLIHNFDKYASCSDAGAVSPNGLEAYVWARINRCGIHSRIYQYDIRHHSDYDSNSATYEYHLHINYSFYRLCRAGHQPTSINHYGVLVADCKNLTRSCRSCAFFIRWIGIFVPGVTTSGPSLNSLSMVASSHMMLDLSNASE